MKSIIFKRISLVFTLLVLSVSMLPLTSCGSDDDEPNSNSIVGGVWVEVDGDEDNLYFDDYPMCVQFNKDHTGAMWCEKNGKIDTKWTYDKFTWSIDGNEISFKITSGESNWNPMEDSWEYNLKNGILDWYGYWFKRR